MCHAALPLCACGGMCVDTLHAPTLTCPCQARVALVPGLQDASSAYAEQFGAFSGLPPGPCGLLLTSYACQDGLVARIAMHAHHEQQCRTAGAAATPRQRDAEAGSRAAAEEASLAAQKAACRVIAEGTAVGFRLRFQRYKQHEAAKAHASGGST